MGDPAPGRLWGCSHAVPRDGNAPRHEGDATEQGDQAVQSNGTQRSSLMSVFMPLSAVEQLVPPFSQVLQLEQQLAVETNVGSAATACSYRSALLCRGAYSTATSELYFTGHCVLIVYCSLQLV